MDQDRTDASLSNVVRIYDERIRDHLGQVVRGTVEENSTACLRRKRTRCATRRATSARRRGGTSGLAPKRTTSGSTDGTASSAASSSPMPPAVTAASSASCSFGGGDDGLGPALQTNSVAASCRATTEGNTPRLSWRHFASSANTVSTAFSQEHEVGRPHAVRSPDPLHRPPERQRAYQNRTRREPQDVVEGGVGSRSVDEAPPQSEALQGFRGRYSRLQLVCRGDSSRVSG